MCLYPKIIKNKKYVENKRNKGVIPEVKDKRVLYVPVGCGKCMECKKQKSRNWQVRLHEEVTNRKDGLFVTMTWSDEEIQKISDEVKELTGYNRDNEIARISIRRFLERWRKKYKVSVRHWLVTELGHTKTERIHIHGIIWTEKKEEIERIWKYGRVWIGDYVNGKTVNYIVKYINKVDEVHKEYNSKIFTSNGIGRGYTEKGNSKLNKYKEGETKETYTTKQGIELPLPIYYRNQIYTEEEKEKLWLEKLDKEERYVNGQKIDVSEGEEEYYKALKYYRKINKRLGYGDNEKNWEQKRYENERRNIKVEERVRKLRRAT